MMKDEGLETFSRHILKAVQDVLYDPDMPSDITLDEVLRQAQVSVDDYQVALQVSKTDTAIILQRQPCDGFVNNYSPPVLRAWRANMDMQFVVNAYACLM